MQKSKSPPPKVQLSCVPRVQLHEIQGNFRELRTLNPKLYVGKLGFMVKAQVQPGNC